MYVRRRIVVASLGVLATWLFLSISEALTAPGTDSVAARLAEWARQHHLGGLVTKAEQLQYQLHPPRTGGAPTGGIPGANAARASSGSTTGLGPGLPSTPAPPPLKPLAGGAPLAGEGVWQTLATVHGSPAVRAAFLRPDAQHTSYLTGVAWLDQRLVTLTLHPGTIQPGGSGWRAAPLIRPQDAGGLLAAFNSGFTLADSRGGFYAEHRTVSPLVAGRASLVVRTDGSATIGQWGRDVTMSPAVASVRQNLDLIVDGGRPVAGLDNNAGDRWGRTVGNAYYVWRSGIGITASGQLVYAAGDALSADSLARVLVDAGAVRAMQLDINRDWTSFDYYHVSNGVITAQKLTADEYRSARRYLSISSRDFYTVYARP